RCRSITPLAALAWCRIRSPRGPTPPLHHHRHHKGTPMAAIAGIIGIGATVAGGALQAQAATQGGIAQQQMYNYQSQVAKINSDIDKQNASYALAQGEVQAMQSGMRYRQEEGHILTTQAASNLDITSGSAVDVRNSERTLASIDAAQIRSNAAKTAYDFDV